MDSLTQEILACLRHVQGAPIEEMPSLPAIDGYCGAKEVWLLQQLARIHSADAKCCYLEVGVYRGRTLLSVASANPSFQCFGVDNFSQFNPNGDNKQSIESTRARLNCNNTSLIDQDFEEALIRMPSVLSGKKIGIYFVDGPHDYRSQFLSLALAVPSLGKSATVIVDDANYAHVRQATKDFLLTHPDFKLVFEAYTECHPLNMSEQQKKAAIEGWWNGVHVIQRDPAGAIRPHFPPTEPDKDLYRNEHLTHSHPLGGLSFRALELLRLLIGGRYRAAWRTYRGILNDWTNRASDGRKLPPQLDTRSEKIAGSFLNSEVHSPPANVTFLSR